MVRESIDKAIFDAIKECMEEPEDGWDAYEEFKNTILNNVMPIVDRELSSVEKVTQPKTTRITKKKKSEHEPGSS